MKRYLGEEIEPGNRLKIGGRERKDMSLMTPKLMQQDGSCISSISWFTFSQGCYQPTSLITTIDVTTKLTQSKLNIARNIVTIIRKA